MKVTSDKYTPLEIFDILGPSARHCFSDVKRTGIYEVDFDTAFKSASGDLIGDLDKLYDALHNGHVNDDEQRKGFHDVFYALVDDKIVRPLQPKAHETSLCRYFIPTTFLRNVAFRSFRDKLVAEQENILKKFMPMPKIGGLIYEVLVINNFSLDDPPLGQWNCFFADDTKNFSFTKQLRPGQLPAEFPDTFDGDVIYIPKVDFPSIDAVAITEQGMRATMLQVTLAKYHEISPLGVYEIAERLWQKHKGAVLTLVFVVVDDATGRKLAARYNNKYKVPKAPPLGVTTRQERGLRRGQARWIDVGWMLCPKAHADREDFFTKVSRPYDTTMNLTWFEQLQGMIEADFEDTNVNMVEDVDMEDSVDAEGEVDAEEDADTEMDV